MPDKLTTIGKLDDSDDGLGDDDPDGDHEDLYIIGAVCLSRKMITLPN